MQLSSRSAIVVSVVASGLLTCHWTAATARAAAVLNFDTGTSTDPFYKSNVNNTTTFSGTATDPDFQGGTAATFTFSEPLSGVDVTTPSSPGFTGASDSFFGAEGTGMGVGNSGLGRFDRGESFTFAANHAFTLDSFLFHEWTGDESLQISWVSDGSAQSGVFSTAGGTGTAPASVTVALSGITADANTPVVVTNVSPSTANSSGRLRFRKITATLVPEPASAGLLALASLGLLRRRRR